MKKSNSSLLRLSYGDVNLRDMQKKDLCNHRRWFFTETEWMKWDAPWEKVDGEVIDTILKKIRCALNIEKTAVRPSLEICYCDATHIGQVNSYYMDRPKERLAVGIGIRESKYWAYGLGGQAFRLWLAYLFNATGRLRLYCSTWSGNVRMIKLAKNCGFSEINRKIGYRQVGAKKVDGREFVLSADNFIKNNVQVWKAVKKQV